MDPTRRILLGNQVQSAGGQDTGMRKALTFLRNTLHILALIGCAVLIGAMGYVLFVGLALWWFGT
jgi:hypothetical protein